VVIAVAIAVPVAPRIGAAAAPTEQLRGQIDRVVQILDDPALRQPAKTAERRDLIRKAAGQIFDYTEVTKRSIGHHWLSRTQAEREEIVQLFGELLERTYISKLEAYSGERVQFTGEQIADDQAYVRTRILTRNNTEIPVEYRMLRRDDRWVVYDVAIEGVSLVANYRTQFNKILQTGSFNELVKRLRAKIDERAEDAPRIQPASQR
jgi:phospholipid transport system substrate-binding protein